ncbi:MAG: FtsX-like permease family protein, partial [Desulfobacterales bacterium]|nr:FtsX-like permease family protein [Desulfobacterales bacterium]
TPSLTTAVSRLQTGGHLSAARLYEFYSIVRTTTENRSLLAMLKVAGRGYPFYGQVGLASGSRFDRALKPGGTIVESGMLERLSLSVGDTLRVGNAALTILDVVTHEPDRPVTFFSFGPRVFIHPDDLGALGLVDKTSRVHHKLLLKVHDPADLETIAATLTGSANADMERVETFQNTNSRMQRFFNNLLFFLNLIGIFTLLLAGIGIQSALTAFLKEKTYTMAIAKTLGATSRFITVHYLLVVMILGLAGTLLGTGIGLGMQRVLPALFSGFLPESLEMRLSWPAMLEGLLLGGVVVALFAYLPLYRLKHIRPTVIFRKESPRGQGGLPYVLCALAIAAIFIALILWQLKDVRLGLYFVAAIIGFIILTALVVQLVLLLFRKRHFKSLVIRQAAKGLFRPGNSTRPILITLTASLAVIFSIYLVESNLDIAYIQSYPRDAPNIFLIDIQKDQVSGVSDLIGEAIFYPVVRARIRAVNNVPVNRTTERKRKGDNLAREFNLTYRHHLLEDERLIRGEALFRSDWDGPQVSVLDTVVRMRKIEVGEILDFNIQGVPLRARVSSIRTRTRESIKPFFYFVFPKEVLAPAPQTFFAATRVEKERISNLQNQVVARFPNISVIDITETARVFSKVMHKLSTIIRFFTSFSIVAGLLIMISAIFATRATRMREAVYFKILGATRGFVRRVFAFENIFIGALSAVLALVIAHVAGYVICSRILDIPYRPFIGDSLVMLVLPVAVVIFVGMGASRTILNKKPVSYLRGQESG